MIGVRGGGFEAGHCHWRGAGGRVFAGLVLGIGGVQYAGAGFVEDVEGGLDMWRRVYEAFVVSK